jgi:Uma2 family endonuclease
MAHKGEPVRRPATYDDLVALPEHVVGEIIDGELIVSPRPRPRHALATSALGMEIGPPYQRGRGGPGGWWILDEPELHFRANVLVPDIAGWRRERMPALPPEPQTWFTLAPDWVCETLSPTTAILDRTRKLDIYRRERVPFVWLVDPAARTLEVLRVEGDERIVAGNYGGDAKVRTLPFDAVELDLAALWEPAGESEPR